MRLELLTDGHMSTTNYDEGASERLFDIEAEIEVDTRYQYRTLKAGEIRTLWLEPGCLGEPLYGWLRCVPLSSDQVEDHAWKEDEARSQSRKDSSHCGNAPDTIDNMDQVEGDDDLSENSSVTSWDGPSLAGYDYCAISYAWGSSELTNIITIDDDYTVPITKSLYEALMYLRDDERCRAFWADALCINQGDVAEKSTQVRMMGEIYAHAFSVSIWLGTGQGLDLLAYCLLCTISAGDYGEREEWANDEEDIAHELVRRLPDYDCICCPVFQPKDANHAYEQALLGIRDLCRRPWFGRLWVAQETALAPNDLWVHSGTHNISFARLETFVSWSTEHTSQRPLLTQIITPRNLDIVANMANIRLNEVGASNPDFVDVLIQTSKLDCANPLDRIYAINALCKTFVDAIDYTASRVEVFSKVTRGFLRAEHSRGSMLTSHNTSSLLTIGPITQARSGDCVDWPSWVPDYNSMESRCEWKLMAHSSTGVSVRTRSTNNPAHICIAGNQVGRVSSILLKSDADHASGLDLTDFFNHFEVREAPDAAKFDAWTEQCAHYLQNNSDALSIQRARVRSTSSCTWNDHTSCLLDDEFLPLQDACNDEHHRSFAFLSLLMTSTSRSRRQVLALLPLILPTIDPNHLMARIETPKGALVGWVPACAAIDDHICVLSDQPEMFVMREASQPGCWTLIGDTFIPGFTSSEDLVTETGDDDWITIC